MANAPCFAAAPGEPRWLIGRPVRRDRRRRRRVMSFCWCVLLEPAASPEAAGGSDRQEVAGSEQWLSGQRREQDLGMPSGAVAVVEQGSGRPVVDDVFVGIVSMGASEEIGGLQASIAAERLEDRIIERKP